MDTNFLTSYLCYRNMLHIANYSEFESYVPDEHFETIASKIGAFYLSCLTFYNYETALEIGQTILFLNRYNKRNLLVWFLTTLKQLFNLTPVQTIL